MARTESFDRHLFQYEQWFVKHRPVYESELKAIEKVLPRQGRGIEIGIGSGLFAEPLGIREGIDPSRSMREKAASRGIRAIQAVAEKLPYKDESIDYVLMVTTICFVDDPLKSFLEVRRIVKPGGVFVIAYVDRDSPVGRNYLKYKDENVFYRDADFFSTGEILELLRKTGFKTDEIVQTVFSTLDQVKSIQQPEKGYGKGSFVVIRALK